MSDRFQMDGKFSDALHRVLAGSSMLPASAYTDSAYDRFERERLFQGSWAAIAFASDVGGAGSVLPCEIQNTPLLITRDLKGILHVFANVCRHRGHLLTEKKCENRKLLTCPYHAWSYALDGRFISAPYWDGSHGSAPEAELASRLGLIRVRFIVWYDIVLVDIRGNAPDFATTVASLEEMWRSTRPSDLLRPFSRKNYAAPGNWKLVAENFLDNYHLPWVHPQVGSSIESAIGLEVENLRLGDGVIGFSHPTAGEEKGKTDTPLPGWPMESDQERARQDLFFIFPNICMVMEGNYLWSMILDPAGEGFCREQISLYIISEEALDVSHEISRRQLAEIIYQINDQDMEVVRKLQRGRTAEASSEGVFNPVHDQLGIWFQQAIARRVLF